MMPKLKRGVSAVRARNSTLPTRWPPPGGITIGRSEAIAPDVLVEQVLGRLPAGRGEALRAVRRHVDEVVALDLVQLAVEEVEARAGGHVEPVLLVVDLDVVEPDAGVERQQAHVEVERGVADRQQLATAEAGDGRVRERLVVAVAGDQAGCVESRPRLVAALDHQQPGRRVARRQRERGRCRQVRERARAKRELAAVDACRCAALERVQERLEPGRDRLDRASARRQRQQVLAEPGRREPRRGELDDGRVAERRQPARIVVRGRDERERVAADAARGLHAASRMRALARSSPRASVTGSAVRSSPSATTTSPPTSSASTCRVGPNARAATGSAIPAKPASSRSQSATSASAPTLRWPSSSSRPRQRAPWRVASSSAWRAVSAVGPPDARATTSAARSSSTSSPHSFEAAPSTPSPTGAPAASSAATGAMPAPSRPFDVGQWATPVPVAPIRRTSPPSRCTQCASQTSSPSQPRLSRYSSGRLPKRSRQNSSSSSVSARCVCSRTPRARASSAVSAISSVLTENGDVGASAIRTIAPGDGSWKRSIADALALRIASRSSTISSGGRPPLLAPRSIAPRQGWKRRPIARAASISTPSRSPAWRGKT